MWRDFVKKAQFEQYARNYGIGGAIAGGSLAALLSAIYYSRKSKRKQPFYSRFLKSLMMTGLGAVGGGLAGSGLGYMLASHIIYKRSVENARKRLLSENKPARYGRVMYVNFPDNKYTFDKNSRPGKILKTLFPKGAGIQHGALLVMDNDGGNAKIYELGGMFGDEVNGEAKEMLQKGISNNDKAMVEIGSDMLSGKYNPAYLQKYDLKDSLKGKDDSVIRKYIADYGKKNDMGDVAELYEGAKNVNINMIEPFLQELWKNYKGRYGILPGQLNCGTAARAAFDSVQGNLSHGLDMLYAGFPSDNAPSMSTKTTGHSYEVEKRETSRYFPRAFRYAFAPYQQ